MQAAIGRIREALFRARGSRPRPHLDDKVLTSWNGLMIAAFARAARVLPSRPAAASYLAAARRAAGFIRRTLWNGEQGDLLHRYRDGEAGIPGYAEDYAFLVFGLLELFQADGDVAWLDWAQELQRAQDERFGDEEEGGWFSTTGADPTVLLRLKEDYDGAEPSASAVSVLNLLTLTHLLPSDRWHRQIERTLGRLGPRAGAAARAVPMMLCGLSAWHAGLSQVVVTGDRDADGTMALERELASCYLPFAIHVPVGPATRKAVGARLEFVAAMTGSESAVYLCRDFTCQQPVKDPASLVRAAVRHDTINEATTMTFDVEIVLRERDYAVTHQLAIPGAGRRSPSDWTDEDVEELLKAILLAIDRARNPESEQRYVALRGFSWIVEPTTSGVVIAIEIPMGAAVAGPFAAEQAGLDRKIRRVIAAAAPHKPVVH